MELVYLWVEDYKNIKRQGFNFSPRFECEFHDKYDENGKLEENCQLEIKSNDYVENFFDEKGKINVTAIVGKNGSGKSNVLALIKNISYENPFISSSAISFLESKKITIYFNRKENILNIYVQNMNITINNKSSIKDKKEKERNNKNIQNILISSTPSHSQKEYILLLDFLKNNNIYFPFNVPKIIQFGIHDDFADLLKLIESNDFDFYTYYNVFDDAIDKRIKVFHVLLLLAYLKNYKIDFKVEASKNYNDTIVELEDKVEDKIKSKINLFIDSINIHLEDFSKNPEHYLDINKIPHNFFKIYAEIIKRKNDKELLDFKGKKVFGFDFFPKLSNGEYQFTYLFNMIYSLTNKENILLLIDEGETFLHPNWQKKYISYLIQFIKDNFPNRKIHIILTSHSPFLLSDIPKQNIIFLDKDENGNCKVVDGLKEKKQTFGANIHTLLSDSFFMEDGLMGEFAKSKIDKAIKLLNKEHLTQDELKYCEQIISIIGEPIVKNQLEKMLHYKKVDYLAKDTKEEIAFLKHRIDLLSKRL